MAGLEDGAHDVRMRVDFVPRDEERGDGAVIGQHSQHAGRPEGVRTVVERERDAACAPGATHDRVDEHAKTQDEDPREQKGDVARERDRGPRERGGPLDDSVDGPREHRGRGDV